MPGYSCFLIMVTLLVGVLFLIQPAEQQLSQSEMLLFQNQNPLKEMQALFEEERPENRQLKTALCRIGKYGELSKR